MTTLRNWIASVAVATAAYAIASPSAAADNDAPTKTVKVWDLDLAKPADVRTLYERVQAAASALCNDEARQEWFAARRRPPMGWTERCVAEAVDGAVRSAEDRRLAALHANAARDSGRLLVAR